jgi:UDP-glucose:(heptosyl)LPS alpha-1,3-glucosyltransferase
MKIAVLRQKVSGPGGAETTLGYLVRGLAAAGHEVKLYGAANAREPLEAWGPRVSYVPVPVWGGKTGRLLSYAINTRRLLRRADVQVVFSLERTLYQQVYRAGDGCHREWLDRRAPFLSPGARTLQKVSLFHRAMLGLEKRLFTDPGLKRVIANSLKVQDEIIRHYRVDLAKIKVIHNGLDREKFQPCSEESRKTLLSQLGAPAGAKIVLFVGSGFGRKGLTYLFEAFGGLKNKDTFLWVVGKGATAPYQRLAHRWEFADRVRFWGAQAEVALFYQAAQVLALPTLYDPCSNVVLEALGCGCPVVTTAANGAAQFLTPGRNGEILARPDDITALRQALTAYADRGRDLEVQHAAQQAVAHLNWDHTTSQTLAVLEEAAGESGR